MQQSVTGRAGKILLLAATIWPLIYMVLFMGFIITMVLSMQQSGGGPAPAPAQWFAGIFVLHILTILLVIALTAIYVVNVFRNDRVKENQKPLWAIVLLLGGMIAMPVYWYLYIWPEKPALSAEGRPAG